MPHITKFAAAPAALAALSLTFAPASAAELPLRAAAPTFAADTAAEQIEEAGKAEHRRYHRYRYRRGPGVGDVLAGVLIVGAIAHAAKAATRDRDDRRYRDRDYRRDARYDDARGIDRAVEMCADAVDRERRVETVDSVDRTASGWIVAGTISRGDGFTCRIDNSGRVVDIDFSGRGARYDDRDDDDRYEDIDYDNDQGDDDDRQWDDDRYASEWSRVDRAGPAETAQAQADQPAYPGGPVEGDEEIDGDLEIGNGYPGAGA